MTHNNISYLEVLEKKRSNLAQEAETNRSNLAKEAETMRADLAKEGQNRYATDKDAEVRLLVAGLSKEAALGAAATSAAASMKNAETNAQAQLEAARLNSETNRYNTDQNIDYKYSELGVVQEHYYQQDTLGWNQLEQDEYYRSENVRTQDNQVFTGFLGDVLGSASRLLPGLLGVGGKKK